MNYFLYKQVFRVKGDKHETPIPKREEPIKTNISYFMEQEEMN